MAIQTINPTTEQVEKVFTQDSEHSVEQKLAAAHTAFQSWKTLSYDQRAVFLLRVADLLEDRQDRYATLMAQEMGKPISIGVGEIKKCALVCRYYAEHTARLLESETIESDARKSYVRFDPLGIILAVMPWNFPFWQVFRFAAPALMAGNVCALKHASNVPQCAEAIEAVFGDAGCPDGVFKNFFLGSAHVGSLIADTRVMAVSLTGSEGAGRSVASTAGNELKKSVLELGGSDPFLVFPDCDLASTVEIAATARLHNSGQTCIAAKRFILHRAIAEEFISRLKELFEAHIVGDPLKPETQIGPLSSAGILKDIERQVAESIERGARVVTGAYHPDGIGYFYTPTILADVRPGMPAYDEELFGPVASIIIAHTEEEMIRIANDTPYGLGASLWTGDTKKAEAMAARIDAGCVAINSMVKSDPRLPFGGIKRSGYGRELAQYGLREFVNIKTVFVA